MSEDFDTKSVFVLSRPAVERAELFSALVKSDAINQIIIWFKERGREVTREEAWSFIPVAIGMSQPHA